MKGKENSGYLHFFVEKEIPILNLMENLTWAYVRKEGQESQVYPLTLSLLFRHLLSATAEAEIEDREKSILLRSLSYIRDNYKNGSLEELSLLVALSPSALSRKLKRETGKTWTELVQEKRMENAVWLLLNTKERVDDIALSVGYENISYFHRLFRKMFSMGPKEYRDARKDTFLEL